MADKQSDFKDLRTNLDDIIEGIHENRIPLILLLDQLTDMGNMGSIFRTADALRVEKVILYRCRFDEKLKKFRRRSRSTEKWVKHEFIESIDELDAYNDYEWIALDKTAESIPYTDLSYEKPIVLVIGNERKGITQVMLNRTSKAIHLPMEGVNISINVAAATAVAAYDIHSKFKNLR